MPPIEPVEVFISYHEKDEQLREELEKHLKTLHREKAITSWHDHKIVAGQEIKGEIDKYLNRAGLILLLVSPDFVASDYHWTVEVTRALERHSAGKARAIPVLMRYADWETPPIDKLSPLPTTRKPVTSSINRDEAFLEVVRGIREEVERLVANSNYSLPKQDEDIALREEQVKAQELEKLQYQVTSLINEADRLREQEKLEEAVLKYKAALRLDPNLAIAHKNLGNALYAQGKLEEAIACYHQALRLNPNYADAHNNLGIALKAQGKLEEAIAELEQAIRLDPSNTLFRNNLKTIRNKKKGFWGRLLGD